MIKKKVKKTVKKTSKKKQNLLESDQEYLLIEFLKNLNNYMETFKEEADPGFFAYSHIFFAVSLLKDCEMCPHKVADIFNDVLNSVFTEKEEKNCLLEENQPEGMPEGETSH